MAKHEQPDDKQITKAVTGLVADSPELRALLVRYAAVICKRANDTVKRKQSYPDYAVGSFQHRDGIPGTVVYTRSNHAKYSNAKHNTLVSIVGGGGNVGGVTISSVKQERARGTPTGKRRRRR